MAKMDPTTIYLSSICMVSMTPAVCVEKSWRFNPARRGRRAADDDEKRAQRLWENRSPRWNGNFFKSNKSDCCLPFMCAGFQRHVMCLLCRIICFSVYRLSYCHSLIIWHLQIPLTIWILFFFFLYSTAEKVCGGKKKKYRREEWRRKKN